MKVEYIDIGTQFSPILGPRYRRDGKFSGQEFRETLLEPAFARADVVVIRLDSLSGYSASFMEEAFGGLVRQHGFEAVNAKIKFEATKRAYLIPKVQTWMRDAGADAPTSG